MVFEIRDRDLLARIGRIRTKSGIVETPTLLPVINPAREVIKPKEMETIFKCEAVITNAYIVKRNFNESAIKMGIHKLLNFNGVIMTDSGAYQILTYGNIEITPEEVIEYQEEIDSDIATILDIPTGWKVSKDYAKYTVEETIRRAEKLPKLKKRDDILWVGPIQGGRYLDLIALSAKKMGSLPFQIHALGSPTPVMEQYLFHILVDMILTAKMNLPPDRPFHLFGAGHPFMFSLAVALGCDLFDSAAYSIYARDNRYMTEYGTIRLSRLEYLPCSCPVCSKRTVKDLMDMPIDERIAELSRHNLYMCLSEVRRIKQAIVEGRLWEYVEMRAHGHPSLLQALKHLDKYSRYIERHTPITKRSGLFFFGSIDLNRPEVIRHRRRLMERYRPSEEAKILILVPEVDADSQKRLNLHKEVSRLIRKGFGEDAIYKFHVCTYGSPFGLIPMELKEVYPLSQYEAALPLDRSFDEHTVDMVTDYVRAGSYHAVVVLWFPCDLGREVSEVCRNICLKKEIKFRDVRLRRGLDKDSSRRLMEVLSSFYIPKEREGDQ